MRKWLTRRNIIILVVLGVILVGIGWNRTRSNNTDQIELVTAQRQDVELTLIATGQITTDKQANLNFQSAGKLAYVNVKVGDRVGRGKALMGLDVGDLRAAETAAYYNYLAADANAKQVEDDLKGKESTETFAEKNVRVAAQTARDRAYDSWLVARQAVVNASLYAPFDGIVTEVTSQVAGDTVGPTDGVTLVDPTSLFFEIEVDESELGLIQIGMPVEISLDAFEDQTYLGSIATIGFVSRLSGAGATVFPVKVVVNINDVGQLRLGMNGDAKMVLKRIDNTLALPVESVADGEVTLPDNKTKKTVVVGLEGDDYVQILEGLNEGEQVVR